MATQAKRIENRIKKLVKQKMTVDNIAITLAIETGSSDRVAIRGYVTQFLEKMVEVGDPDAKKLLYPHG
jgi:ATP-dependent Clp protease adapter protein ClpS